MSVSVGLYATVRRSIARQASATVGQSSGRTATVALTPKSSNMRFQVRIGCESSGKIEASEQHAIEQRVFAARVVHLERRLGVLGGSDVAREVNSTSGVGQVELMRS